MVSPPSATAIKICTHPTSCHSMCLTLTPYPSSSQRTTSFHWFLVFNTAWADRFVVEFANMFAFFCERYTGWYNHRIAFFRQGFSYRDGVVAGPLASSRIAFSGVCWETSTPQHSPLRPGLVFTSCFSSISIVSCPPLNSGLMVNPIIKLPPTEVRDPVLDLLPGSKLPILDDLQALSSVFRMRNILVALSFGGTGPGRDLKP